MTKIKNFLKQLFFGTTNYTNIKCDCGSEKLEYYNESADGFYVEFECNDCKNHITI